MTDDIQRPSKRERWELRQQEKEAGRQQRVKNRLLKRITLWSLVVIGIGAIVFGMIKLGGSSSQNQTSSLVDTISISDWTKGNKDAEVILVEYSDFQCPACGSYYPIVEQLNEEFEKSIQFVYRHFPLRQIHANAELAAHAAEAAGKQDKFWEMHDMIFENQREWSNQSRSEATKTFTTYTEQLDLDTKQFKEDLDSKEVKEKVNNDYQSGIKSGVNSTPTFFLNGEKIQNPRNHEEFRNIINQAISSDS